MPPMDTFPGPPAGPGFTVLAGVHVLDLTTSIAGPYAIMLLGDLGAEVIEVERPGAGDDARHWARRSWMASGLRASCRRRRRVRTGPDGPR